jgi:hypothetical protein
LVLGGSDLRIKYIGKIRWEGKQGIPEIVYETGG